MSGARARTPPSRRRIEPSALDGIRTPDGRYLVVRGRLWRATNPALPEAERSGWVRALMNARRALAAARTAGDVDIRRTARHDIEQAKQALGERGPVWWEDGEPDHNRRLVMNTPYGDWYDRAQRNVGAILCLLDARADGSICPSDAARAAHPRDWRRHLGEIRDSARHLARRGLLVITQRGRPLDPDSPFRGPIRLRRATSRRSADSL